MGSNNKKKEGYGPNPGQSGGDSRGRTQNQSQYQQQRFESQQGPLANATAFNYGRGSETDYQNYGDIMNQYRDIAANPSSGGTGKIGYNDPFNSYAGYTDFSKTGGYSGGDIANLRARGVAPIRAAYANAEREVGRQRSLQGGYSPNAAAARVKMAREQGQGMADAVQNVEGGIVDQRNRNQLSGLGGMSNIEGQRLNADLDVGKFNAQSDQLNDNRRLAAVSGMTSLYGTNPGMSQTFGNQALGAVGMGGDFGNTLYRNDIVGQQLPGQFDTTMGRIGDVADIAGRVANPMVDYFEQRRRKQNPDFTDTGW